MEHCQSIEVLDLNRNLITDKGVEMLMEYIIGNPVLQQFNISENPYVTDKSIPNFIEMAKKSCITFINLSGLANFDNYQEIEELFKVPIDQREVPISSNSKSAAKTSSA